MANWCENNIMIRFKDGVGNKEKNEEILREIDDRIRMMSVNFECFFTREAKVDYDNKKIPIDALSDAFGSGRYEIFEMEDFEGKCIQLYITTAWSPLVGLGKLVTTLYPGTVFDISFYEPGNGFVGEATFEDGVFVKQKLFESDEVDFFKMALSNGYEDEESLEFIVDEEDEPEIYKELRKGGYL